MKWRIIGSYHLLWVNISLVNFMFRAVEHGVDARWSRMLLIMLVMEHVSQCNSGAHWFGFGLERYPISGSEYTCTYWYAHRQTLMLEFVTFLRLFWRKMWNIHLWHSTEMWLQTQTSSLGKFLKTSKETQVQQCTCELKHTWTSNLSWNSYLNPAGGSKP